MYFDDTTVMPGQGYPFADNKRVFLRMHVQKILPLKMKAKEEIVYYFIVGVKRNH